MFKKIFNLYIRYKTKNLKAIPLFVMTFDWKKFQKDGKKDSCILYSIHPDIANDPFLKEKLSECVDYIRDNYDMEIFTKFSGRESDANRRFRKMEHRSTQN